MYKRHKFRLYPTEKQKVLLNKQFGACRFIYNLALETKENAYKTHQVNISKYELMRQYTQLRRDYEWLQEVISDPIYQAIHDLDKAFVRFFKGLSGYPKFKKKNSRQSFRIIHARDIRFFDNRVKIPKIIEGIKFVQSCEIKGKIKQSTIIRSTTGKYFISILVDDGKIIPVKLPISDKAIGIDLGLKHFAVTSEGQLISNPRYLDKSLSKLKYLQRQMAKKAKGSRNKIKCCRKLTIQYEKITNQRKNFLHKLSADIINNHDTVCLEDLNIEGLKKRRNLSKAISDAGWGEFVRQLKYKAEWRGKTVLQLPTFQPSTKICSDCGLINNGLTLADREWICECGSRHDRDINAAINIKNYCLKNYDGGKHRLKPVELPVVIRSVEAGR